MRYSEESGCIHLTVREMLAFSLFRYTGTSPEDALLPLARADGELCEELGYPSRGQPLEKEFSSGGYRFSLRGEVDAIELPGRRLSLTLLFSGRGEAGLSYPSALRAAKAEASLLAFLAGGKDTDVTLVCYHPVLGTSETVHDRLSAAKIARFFEEASSVLALYASSEIARVRQRLPAMRRLSFPYPETRLGQEELMKAVYRTVSRGETLFASAPTGLGKTISTLYPAIRAMGAGKCEKVFYLTAKATAARAAAEEAELLGKGGALRAVMLASKERICPSRGAPCREGSPCERATGGAREDMAVQELILRHAAVIGVEEISEVAARHRVCPHALALSYSMTADLVICDYNYLFDPVTRLSRYFSLGGRYCFLIDEAHNLISRVRDTYAIRLTEGELLSLPLPDGEGAPRAATDAATARDALVAYLRSLVPDGIIGKEVLRSLPEGLLTHMHALAEPMVALFRNRTLPSGLRKQLRSSYYELKNKLCLLGGYDGGFRLVLSREEAGASLATLCLDPSGVVRSALAMGKSAVFFSATLSPIVYYRDLLGGSSDTEVLELPSPFERENLAVAVLDKVSLRYADREETLAEVAAAVEATVSARRGNYMVFCPSYSYAARLGELLSARGRTPRILLQSRTLTQGERALFLEAFSKGDEPVLGICVLGGVFSEGVDLVGRRLIGAVVIGVGLPTPSEELHEIASYFAEKCEAGGEYAYVYPGMNRVLQAAGRVIRDEGDVGVVVLIDDRFATPLYRRLLPSHWRGLTYAGNVRSLSEYLRRFWARHPEK